MITSCTEIEITGLFLAASAIKEDKHGDIGEYQKLPTMISPDTAKFANMQYVLRDPHMLVLLHERNTLRCPCKQLTLQYFNAPLQMTCDQVDGLADVV